MSDHVPVNIDDPDDMSGDLDQSGDTPEEDLWFLPGPLEDEPEDIGFLPLRDPGEAGIIDEWKQAEAGHAALLARVAFRIGRLDERLIQGPDGWKRRLALMETSELGWTTGARVSADRLALWFSLRLSGVQDDALELSRLGWAYRRLSGGTYPEDNLADFLGRLDPSGQPEDAERFSDNSAGWLEMMKAGRNLHPVTRACMGYHIWNVAGLGDQGNRVEAAVTASRIAAQDCAGAVSIPLAMGGAGGLNAEGSPAARLSKWLDVLDRGILTAMRHLDDIEAWAMRAQEAMQGLSGRTPPALRAAFIEWPLLSAPMAEKVTGASRPSVHRSLSWMEGQGLVREVTGQGRFKMWRVNI